jgi:hypothetical protein
MYGTREESAIRTDTPTNVTENDDGSASVSQRKGHGKRVTETWGRVKV